MRGAWIGLVVACVACVKAPAIVMVDRATALEQQAGASFPEPEKKLARAAAVAQPVPLTPEQLEAHAYAPSPIVEEHDQTNAEVLDDWLERHCVGEGNDGLLAETKTACRGVVDHDEVVKLVDRTNRSRMQVWRWMQEREPTVSLDELRKRWRAKHATGVTCGAWIQDDAGTWREKSC